MKKLSVLLFVAIMILSLVACGGQSPAPAEATPEPAAEITPEPTPEPIEDERTLDDIIWAFEDGGFRITNELRQLAPLPEIAPSPVDTFAFHTNGVFVQITHYPDDAHHPIEEFFENLTERTPEGRADTGVGINGAFIVFTEDEDILSFFESISMDARYVPREIPVFEIGEMAVIGEWEVTVNAAEWTNRVEAGRFYYNPLDDNTFLYTSLTVTNLGTTPETFLSRLGRGYGLFYADTFNFAHTRLPSYRDTLLEGMLTSPLTSSTGSIVFTVADRAVESDGSMILVFIIGREEIRFNVRP